MQEERQGEGRMGRMQRMIRRIGLPVSGLLLIAVSIVWVRSYWQQDYIHGWRYHPGWAAWMPLNRATLLQAATSSDPPISREYELVVSGGGVGFRRAARILSGLEHTAPATSPHSSWTYRVFPAGPYPVPMIRQHVWMFGGLQFLQWGDW